MIMNPRTKRLVRIASLALALGFVAPLASVATAQAATVRCYNVGTTGTQATATCTGTGRVRLNVECNTVAPFPRWTDRGPLVTINGGYTLANAHAWCGGSVRVYTLGA